MGKWLKTPVVQYSAVGVGLLLVVVVALGQWGAFDPRSASAVELHAMVSGDGLEASRVEAAVALSRHADATPAMLREVIENCELPAAQAAAIAGLGKRKEINSLPMLIDAMESDSELVRGRAGVAVERIVGLGMGFEANAAPQQRKKAIARYREFWAECQKPESKFLEYYDNPAAIEASARAIRRKEETNGT